MFWLWYTSLPSSWLKIDSFTISWFSHEGFNHTMSCRAQHKAVELKATNCIDNQAFWTCFSTNVPQHAPEMLACFPALQFFKLLLAMQWPVILLFFQVHMFEEKCFLYHLATTQLPSLWQAPLDASLLFHCWQPCLTWNAGRPPNNHGTRPSNPPGFRLLHIHAPRRTGCRSTRPSDRYRHIRHKDRHSTHQQLDGKAEFVRVGW